MSLNSASESTPPSGSAVIQGKKESIVVVDAGPLIRGLGMNLHKLADRVVTTEDVIKEIRDSRARANLDALPYRIETIEPSPECTKQVVEFSRKTGDYQSLSLTDIKLIALALTLEKQQNGDKNIRKTPVASLKQQVAAAAAANKGKAAADSSKVAKAAATTTTTTTTTTESSSANGPIGEIVQEVVSNSIAIASSAEGDIKNNINSNNNINNSSKIDCCSAKPEVNDEEVQGADTQHSKAAQKRWRQKQKRLEAAKLKSSGESTAASSGSTDNDDSSKVESVEVDEIDAALSTKPRTGLGELYAPLAKETLAPPNVFKSGGSRIIDTSSSSSNSFPIQLSSSDYDDSTKPFVDNGKGWISKDNITVVKSAITRHGGVGSLSYKFVDNAIAEDIKDEIVEEESTVSCITNDFALQNVLVQMGLRLVSVDGQKITKVKQFVIRCIACFHIHYDTNIMFCSACGINHLSKVAASIDANTGELKLHLKDNYVVGTKGLVHSLPAAGKQGRYEGELLLRADQLKTGIWKQKLNRIKKDVSSAFGEEITNDVGLHVNKGNKIVYGMGTKNPNQQRGRERRGKSKK